METKPILAWHFLAEDCQTRREHGYPPPVLVEVGQTLTESRPLRICKVGLHASIRAIDALHYAPGPIICRVEMSGASATDPNHQDKLCYERRTVLAMADASALLHEFACWCAEGALKRELAAQRDPDARCWAAITAKRQWMRDEITTEQLAAARAAAWAAVEAAVEAAAMAAVWAAVEAEGEAAGESAWRKQNAELERRLREILGAE